MTAVNRESFGVFSWPIIGKGEVGESLSVPTLLDPTVQVVGEFGLGAVVILEGSLEQEPKSWFPLVNRQGETASFTRPGGMLVAGAFAHIRPRVQGGDDSTRVVVLMLFSERNR